MHLLFIIYILLVQKIWKNDIFHMILWYDSVSRDDMHLDSIIAANPERAQFITTLSTQIQWLIELFFMH